MTTSEIGTDLNLERARALFPHTAQARIYLNHASTAPMSTPVTQAISQHLRERSYGIIETLSSDLRELQTCRGSVTKLINAESPDRIALIGNTSEAINIVCSGLPWRSGDRVLLRRDDFPANIYPYLNLKQYGVELDFLETESGGTTPELVEEAITPRTRVVALSAVHFLTGYRINMKAIGELCRERQILFVVDGIQAVGAVRIDVQQMKVDALAAGSQKWQLGPQGTGFLYLSEDLQSSLSIRHLGWLAVSDPWDFHNYEQPLSHTARRFEGGTRNIPGIWGMNAAATMLLDFGIPAVESQILSLTSLLVTELQALPGIELLTSFKPEERAGIVTIELPPSVDPKETLKFLARNEITVSLREGKLRFSPHFYNSTEEIALTIDTLKEAIRQR